jgi:POT family proton-dependent oligopeptide transporter
VGNGFFKPNISTFVAALYQDNDPRKDSGFVIFYMGINIGGFVAPLLCGWLGASYGWHYGFGLAGVGMLTGLAFFWQGIKAGVFAQEGLPPSQERLNKKVMGLSNDHWVSMLAFLSAPVIAFLLSSYEAIAGGNTFFGDQNLVNLLFKGIGIAVALYLGYILFQATVEERKKLIVAIFITVFMTLFWGFHELSGSVITLFADRNVDLSLINASQTNALNSMFIIILSIPISLLFTYLSKKNLNPRTPFKFGIGLMLAGVSFYVLKLSGTAANEDNLVPFAYLIIMYFLISIGELFMSPVGLSKITDLSPKRIVAFMMGIWFLSSSYAFQLVGFIGKQLAVESSDKQVDNAASLTIYIEGFELISIYAIGAGVIVLILAPFLNKLMGDVH